MSQQLSISASPGSNDDDEQQTTGDVIRYFERYYGLGLVLALVLPLWLAAASSQTLNSSETKDAWIWSGVLLGCWLLVRKYPGLQVKGFWRRATPAETLLYVRVLLGVLLIDFGSKALFFRWDYPYPIEIFKNFGLQSVFHVTAFESFHLILLLYFIYLFVFGALFFRFSNRSVDRIWLVSSPLALGGAVALFLERLMFGGVHDSFYFAGPLMWLCPPCASSYFSSYAWTPADFFVHAAFAPPLILIVSFILPISPSANASAGRSPSS
jgi:lipoprotein signal peptidase